MILRRGTCMKFGVFDHMDDAGVPLGQLYADRLALVEAYDRAGIYGYHLAEHHSTPLGCAASPGLFLAAVAQRTKHAALRPAGLSAAVLPSAAPDRGNLHARSDERRAPPARRRARRVAVRDPRLRPRLREDRRDLSRGLPAHAQGPRRRRADLRRQALPVPQRADDPAAGAAPASAAVVRHHDPGERGLAGGKRRQHRDHCAAPDRPRHHRPLPRRARAARQGRRRACR